MVSYRAFGLLPQATHNLQAIDFGEPDLFTSLSYYRICLSNHLQSEYQTLPLCRPRRLALQCDLATAHWHSSDIS